MRLKFLKKPASKVVKFHLACVQLALAAFFYGHLASSAIALTDSSSPQLVWESTPYRIVCQLGFENSANFPKELRKHVEKKIQDIIATRLGAVWSVELHRVDLSVVQTQLRSPLPAATDKGSQEVDKLFFVLIQSNGSATQIATREWDNTTLTWGNVSKKTSIIAHYLPSAIFETLWKAFRPLAKVQQATGTQAILTVQAGTFELPDSGKSLLPKGALVRPVVRILDRDGNSRPNGIRSINWTYLQVTNRIEERAFSEIKSGIRQPLSARRRGRTEIVTIAFSSTNMRTTLKFRGQAAKAGPLVGYGIWELVDGRADLLGHTDSQGEFVLSASSVPLRMLYIKHGDRIIAKLPVVPGYQPEVTLTFPDDTALLQAEGVIDAIQEEMVDTFAQNQLLIALIERRLDMNDRQNAMLLLHRLKQLPTQQSLIQRLNLMRQQLMTESPLTNQEIDRLFNDTRKLIAETLSSRPIAEIELRLSGLSQR